MFFETPIRSSQQIGQLIASARRKKKLSQRDVARELGVTQAWISRVEGGQQKAWIGQVLRLAAWLDLEIIGRPKEEDCTLQEDSIFPDINDVFRPKKK